MPLIHYQNAFFYLRRCFYFLALLFYLERQWNFDFYYSAVWTEVFHTDFLNFVFRDFHYADVVRGLKWTHFLFLTGLVAGVFRRLPWMVNFLMFGFNFLLLNLNFSFGYAGDIFIQLGFFFFLFCNPRTPQDLKNPYSQISLVFLRFYLGIQFLFSAIHKLIDGLETGNTFLQNLATIQARNQVWDGLVFSESFLAKWNWQIFGFILFVQTLAGCLLLFRRTKRMGAFVLICFHLASIPLLNLILFPLIAIVLVLMTCLPEPWSVREVVTHFFQDEKNNSMSSPVEVI